MSEPRVSVVVCTYTEQRWDDLVAAVASVRGQRLPAADDEVVVVVDPTPLGAEVWADAGMAPTTTVATVAATAVDRARLNGRIASVPLRG